MMKQSVSALLVLFAMTTAAWPQSSTSTVRGTVRDQTGAVVPAAAVSLTNVGTNVGSRTITNEVGIYTFAGVLPGPYRLAVEAAGMRKYEASLTAQVQEAAVVDPVLSIGETSTLSKSKTSRPCCPRTGLR